MIKKLLYTLSKIRFRSPKRANVLVYDACGLTFLHQCFLKGFDYTVLYTRFFEKQNNMRIIDKVSHKETVYFSLKIVLWFLVLLVKRRNWLILKDVKGLSLYSKLIVLYFLAVLHYVKPRLAITYIDDDRKFMLLSYLYPHAKFLSIQNGMREEESLSESAESFNDISTKITNFTYYVFGEYDLTLNHKLGFAIDYLKPVGSCKAAFAKAQYPISLNGTDYEGDITFISNWRSFGDFNLYSSSLKDMISEVQLSLEILLGFIQKFCFERKMRIHILLATNLEEEKLYYTEKLKHISIKFLPNERHLLFPYNTYNNVLRSEFLISHSSTLGLEALSLHKKILICVFSDNTSVNPFITFKDIDDAIWYSNKASYGAFATKIESLQYMSQSEYENEIDSANKYFMNYSHDRPAHKVIREHIENVVG